MWVVSRIAVCALQGPERMNIGNVAALVHLIVRASLSMRNVVGRGVFLGLVLMRVAVRQRRRRGGEPRSERESKPKESCESRANHGLKLRRVWGAGNPADGTLARDSRSRGHAA